jgi:hypothetical protein
MNNKITLDFSDVNSQLTAVMWHLKEFGSITSLEAIKEYGITRLAEYIRQMRQMGYSITTEDVTNKNRFGNSVTYGKYIYNNPDQITENGQIKLGI